MTSASTERQLYVAARWQAYAGESRANLLRSVGVAVMYLVHFWSYASSQGHVPHIGLLQIATRDSISGPFHLAVTLLTLAWGMLAAAVHLCLRGGFFPEWLPRATTVADVLLLTSVAAIGAGPASPIVGAYFLVIILAGLRFDLMLVRLATAASAAGYLVLLGMAKWDLSQSLASTSARLPRYHQLIVLVSMVLAGLFVGQLVRQSRTALRHALSSEERMP